MGTPYPGTGSPEEGNQDGHMAMDLCELYHVRVCAGIQEKCGDSIPITIQGRHNRGQKVGVGVKHV